MDIPAYGWVNLHFSLLPAWRGAAPVQHAILHGDDVTGATTFRIVRELDAGPVYGMVTEPIRPADTAADLLGRLSIAGAELLVATLDGIESGELEARPQPVAGVSLAPKITTADAEINWLCRPLPSAASSAPARRRPVRGRSWAAFASKSARSPGLPVPGRLTAPGCPMGMAGSVPASCGCSLAGSWSEPARCRWNSAKSSRTASGGCGPPTGPAACTLTAGGRCLAEVSAKPVQDSQRDSRG